LLKLLQDFGSNTQMSPIIRAISGVLGFGGVAAIAFNAYSKGDFEADFLFFSSLLGGFAFLYIAFFGVLPWGASDNREVEKGAMSKSKWQLFWIAIVVFLAVATAFLAEKGVFQEASIVVLAIVGISFAVIGVALYFYIRDRAEDINIRW